MNAPSSTDAENIYAFQAKDIHGADRSLSGFRGQVLLIVNVASRCGFTPQYKDLESLYEKYRDRGFTILGFPCNQFGFQEPGSDPEIEQFCQLNFGVQFPMYSKISVNGSDAHPLYVYLKHAAPGILGTEAIKWNFTKFLVDRDGKVVGRYPPSTTPEALIGTIETLLDAHPAQPANGS